MWLEDLALAIQLPNVPFGSIPIESVRCLQVTSTSWGGQFWTPMVGQFSKPIDKGAAESLGAAGWKTYEDGEPLQLLMSVFDLKDSKR
ncbi:MAG: hypothetical protein PHI31_17275 [Desulfuromonadaceae bacterium]|nr:hypothetical protein [Desulfuromonadaceae bacterium]